MTLTIDVPAERWEELANINSCMAASSFDPKKGKPLAVKSDVFQGRRYIRQCLRPLGCEAQADHLGLSAGAGSPV